MLLCATIQTRCKVKDVLSYRGSIVGKKEKNEIIEKEVRRKLDSIRKAYKDRNKISSS